MAARGWIAVRRSWRAALAAAALSVLIGAGPALSRSVLRAGEALAPGEAVAAEDRVAPYALFFWPNGALTVEIGEDPDDFAAGRRAGPRDERFSDWSAGTADKGAVAATMRPDGDFVVTDAAGAVLWRSGTDGFPGAELRPGRTGEPEIVFEGRAIWAAREGRIALNISGAGAPHRDIGDHLASGAVMRRGEMLVYRGLGAPMFLKLSPDGRLGLYGPGETMRSWSPDAPPAGTLTMRPDGDLVLADAAGSALWRSGSQAAGASLLLDGVAAVVAAPGANPIWSTGRGRIEENITGFGAPHRSVGGRLRPGATLRAGEMLVSEGGGAPVQLRLSADGDFGLYDGALRRAWAPLRRRGVATALSMGHDGRLSLTDAAGGLLWRAQGRPGASAVLDTFGLHLVASDGPRLWSTANADSVVTGGRLWPGDEIWGPWRLTVGTQTRIGDGAPGGAGARLIVGADGSVELRHDLGDTLIWRGGAPGNRVMRSVFERGALILYDADDRPVGQIGPGGRGGGQLQLDAGWQDAAARIVDADGAVTWSVGQGFGPRRYRFRWTNLVMREYLDGADNSPFVYGLVGAAPAGGATRVGGHADPLWNRTAAGGERVNLPADFGGYAYHYPRELDDKYQDYLIPAGPGADYAAAATQGVTVNLVLWDYDAFSPDDLIGVAQKMIPLSQLGDQTITLSNDGVTADFSFRVSIEP